MSPIRLDIKEIEKSFDENKVLRKISFHVNEGECIALVGENGAGKSTLMKILSGVWPAGSYSGEFLFEGKPLSIENPIEARVAGISIIHQELCLFSELTVAENLFLTEEAPYEGLPSEKMFRFVSWPSLFKKAENLLGSLGFQISAKTLVKDLSIAEKQLVEIARAIHHGARLLILDEPTSALTEKEIRLLFKVIEKLKANGTSLIYISHKMEEIFEVSDRIVVLRDGKSVADLKTSETNTAEVISAMVGRPYQQRTVPMDTKKDFSLLKVSGLNHFLESGKHVLKDISFEMKAGEILGISGLMGSGRSELLKSLLGVLPGRRSGETEFLGKKTQWRSIDQAMKEGCGFVPEDRKKEGLFLENSVMFNTTITILEKFLGPLGFVRSNPELNQAEKLCKQMRVRFSGIQKPIRFLSGGNQQKVLLAKMVALNPKLLILDEPTRGIDVGAKEEIYEFIQELSRQGIGVLVVSSELPELLNLCQRVLVMKEGRLVGNFVNQNLTQEIIMSAATEGAMEWNGLRN